MKWHDDITCKLCGKPCTETDVVCLSCLEKLQTTFAELCLNCGNYHFVEWLPETVQELCNKINADFDVVYNTTRAVIIPYKTCPKCCKDKLCQAETRVWQ